MSWQILSALVAAVFCVSIGFLVYLKNPKRDLNQFFALYNFSLGFWNLGDFFVSISQTPSAALLWDRFSYVGAVFLGPLWINFSLAFTEIKGKKATRILFLFACVLAPITFFTPWVIRTVTISPFTELEGPLYPLFVIFFLGSLTHGSFLTYKTYRKVTGLKRIQFKYMFFAMFVGIIAAIIYFLTLVSDKVPPVHYLIEILYVTIIAYAIIKYQLMDIRMAIRPTQWGLEEKAIPLLERDLQQLGANVVIPAYDVGSELFGFLALGRTRSGRSLEPGELQELALLANQAVSAIKNTEAIKQLEAYHKHMGHAEKLASMGQLMSSLIHDINNPLTVVCGNAQMLKLRWEGKLAEDDIKKVTQIDECGRRAAGILQRLLKFSKPSGEEMMSIKIDEVVKKTVELAHGQLSFEDLGLELDLKAGCEILGNEMQLEEVIWNLFNNAWQAMHGRGKIRVTSEKSDGHARVIVEDTGPGMAQEIVAKIFEPFYTTKKEGTGLGLYITHLIVLAHRGKIHCESIIGQGTKFIIEIPVYEGKLTRGLWRKPR